MQRDGRTDTMKLRVAFHNFVKAPKQGTFYNCISGLRSQPSQAKNTCTV